MNLFLSPLGKTPLALFFNDDGSDTQEVVFKKDDCFSDVLCMYPEFTQVQNIFYVSGPASFTALRNMSVFLNIFSHFSQKKIPLFAIPSHQFLLLAFPFSSAHILSVGRRESFLFEYSGHKKYKKYKNHEALKYLKEKNIDVLGGEFSEEFLHQAGEDFTFSFSQPQREILEKILEKKKTNPELWKTSFAKIEYGSLPNIGAPKNI